MRADTNVVPFNSQRKWSGIVSAFSSPNRIVEKVGDWFKPRSKVSVILIGVALLMLVGLMDYLASPQVVLSLFYLGPILFVAGCAGRTAGIVMAVASAGVWLAAELLGPVKYSVFFIPYWNALVTLGIFVIAAWLVSTVRVFHDKLETRLEQRTVVLQAEVAVRRLAEDQLRTSEQRFRQVTEAITEVFWMTNIEKTEMIYVSPGYEKVWGRTCQSLYAAPRTWLESIHAKDRERVLCATLTKQATGDYDEEYRILRPDGSIRWIRDRAFPVHDESGKVYRLAGIAEDITERKRFKREILGIIDCEQARIALELHDGLCQQLVRTAFAVNLLEQDLAAQAPVEPARARKIAALLDDAVTQARSIARGLYPVKVETGSLDSALLELCRDTSAFFPVACEFICHRPGAVSDIATASHLYRIAQEAVHNAVKHSQASRIVVAVDGNEKTVTLSITDDGVGIGPHSPAGNGMGLRIMQYRARTISAALEINRAVTGGTMVRCSLPQEDT